MKWINVLERKYRRWAIPNLTMILVIGQAAVFLLGMLDLDMTSLTFSAEKVLQGEVLRLVTFMFIPFSQSFIWEFFALFIFYLMGSSLEREWGDFRYNLYVFMGYFLVLLTAFLVPQYQVSNYYIELTVFFAFAFLFPDYSFLLFFVLPVKVKYLAILGWLLLAFQIVTAGSFLVAAVILISVSNFFIFFGPELKQWGKQKKRFAQTQIVPAVPEERPFKRCAVCGVDERTDPGTDFRFCPECEGMQAYCPQHIFSHEHNQ